jgi:hypothetical protein
MVCRVAERRPQRCAAESFAARRSPVPTLPPLKSYPATRICAHARHARRCSAPQRSVALAGFAVRGWAAFGAALDLGHTAGHREGQPARRRRKAARAQRRRNEAEVPGCSAPSGGVSGRPRAAGRPLPSKASFGGTCGVDRPSATRRKRSAREIYMTLTILIAISLRNPLPIPLL